MNKNKTLDGRRKADCTSGSGAWNAPGSEPHREKTTSPNTLKLREHLYSPPSAPSLSSRDRINKDVPHGLSRRQKRVLKKARQAKALANG